MPLQTHIRSASRSNLELSGLVFFLVSLLVPSRAGADLWSCGERKAPIEHCLLVRGQPTMSAASGHLSMPVLALSEKSGVTERLGVPALTLTASAADQARRVEGVRASASPFELVVVLQKFHVRTPKELTPVLKTGLQKLLDQVAQTPGSRVHLLSYAVDPLPIVSSMDVDSDAGEPVRAALAALETTELRSKQGLTLAVSEALDFLHHRQHRERRAQLVIISDGITDNVPFEEAQFRRLARTAAEEGVTVDILSLNLPEIPPAHQGYYELALHTSGIVHIANSPQQLADELSRWLQELSSTAVLDFVLPLDPRSSPQEYRAVLSMAGLSVPLANPLRAALTSPAPRSMSWHRLLGGVALGIVLLGLGFQLLRRRTGVIAWMVPLSGPQALQTLQVPPRGLSLGNRAVCDAFVPATSQRAVVYRLRPGSGARYEVTCPPGSSLLLDGVPVTDTALLSDGALLCISELSFLFKVCVLSATVKTGAS